MKKISLAVVILGLIATMGSMANTGLAGAEGTTDWRDPNTSITWYYGGHADYATASTICGAIGGRIPLTQEAMTAVSDGIATSNGNWSPRGINILESGYRMIWTTSPGADPASNSSIGVGVDQSINPMSKTVQLHTACITAGGSNPSNPPAGDNCSRFASSGSCLDYDGGNGPWARGCRWSNVANQCFNNWTHDCSFYTRMGSSACLDYDSGQGPWARGCRWDNGDNSCKHQ